MKVVWTQNALQHLTDIYDYIAKDSAGYAIRMVDRITGRSKQFGIFPESGQSVVEYNTPNLREVVEGQYRIIYCVRSERVEVLAVIHGARQLPSNIKDL